ncbi:MAG: glycosyltransferase [Balneolaceae bacterium]|nr:glycosyltransferase [Balneolaceae bacterium]
MKSKEIKVGLIQISNSIGGSEIRMAKYAVELSRDKYISPVLVINQSLARAYESRELINRSLYNSNVEIRVIRERGLRIIRFFQALQFSRKWYFRVFNKIFGRILLKIYPPSRILGLMANDLDVIHSFFGKESLSALLDMPNIGNKKLIQEVTSHRVVLDYVRVMAAVSNSRANKIYMRCVSETVKEALEESFREKNILLLKDKIIISVNPGPFVGTILPIESESKERKIVFGHRLQPSKNGLLFASAVSKIIDKNLFPDWKFYIFGRGKERDAINKILESKIAMGHVSMEWTDNLEAVLKNSSIFVSLINTGNYPSQSLFESLGHGNLLCLSDTGLTKEKIGNKEGVTFYCNLNESSVINSIESAVSYIDLYGFERSQLNARKHYYELHKKSNYMEELLGIYKSGYDVF